MTLLATASINTAFVLLPSRMPARAACAFWLTNPLLLEKHPDLVKERMEQYPGWSSTEQHRLATRLKAQREKLKHQVPVPADSIHPRELLAVLSAHEVLIDPRDEYQQARELAMVCHPAEREWLLAHFTAVLEARSAALEEHDNLGQDEYDDLEEAA
ncbi:hypothetical protein LGH70_19710 [Hymenobacter sp. BT635]|uniref:Uncharacterized protein n=1 Tax=Hymenobacter nitidus TaxID=2880929 RepID=A0ABS8AHB2_9BACT|nr:hypothetical protein [Hymenobacter nitidus]MCB2379833.1 hypothetical protein [Hymenobacter nitidus]